MQFLARYPSAGRAGPWRSYSRLLRKGLAKPPCCHDAGGLLHHRFSFSLTRTSAGSGSLLFCGANPSGRPAWPLTSFLPCGARTFLTPAVSRRSRDRLARFARRYCTTRPALQSVALAYPPFLVKQAIDTRPTLQSVALAYLAATASVRPHILLPHSGALAYHPVLKHRRASCARSDMFACRAEGAGGCVALNTQARMSLLQTGSGWDPVALRQIRRAERSYSRTMRNCARRRRVLRSPGYGRRVIELHCSGRVAESGMIHLLCAPGWDPVALLRYAGKDDPPPNGFRLGTGGIASNTQVGMLRRRLVRAAHG